MRYAFVLKKQQERDQSADNAERAERAYLPEAAVYMATDTGRKNARRRRTASYQQNTRNK